MNCSDLLVCLKTKNKLKQINNKHIINVLPFIKLSHIITELLQSYLVTENIKAYEFHLFFPDFSSGKK